MDTSKKKEDLRIRRTYKLLMEALLSLMEEKPFDKINVTDICERAMVHRTTFYKHFEDKYHLLCYSLKELENTFMQDKVASNDFNTIKQHYMNVAKNVLEHMSSNSRLYKYVIEKNKKDAILSIFHSAVVDNLVSQLELTKKLGAQLPVPIPIIAEFHAGAVIATVSWWIEHDMPIPADELVRYMDFMIQQGTAITKQ